MHVHTRLALTCAALLLSFANDSLGQTWNGGGTTSFSDPANWTGGTPVSNGATTLNFGGITNTGTSGSPLQQDIGSPMSFGSITFDNTAGPFFIGGNAFAVGAASTITQNSANAQTLSTGFSRASGFGTLNLAGTGTGVATLSGSLSDVASAGTLAIAKSGANSTYVLSNANSFTGTVTINAGTLVAGNAAALGTASATISSGALEIRNVTITNFIALNNGATLFGSGANAKYQRGSGLKVAGGANVAIGTIGSADTLTLTSAVDTSGSGTRNITVVGAGSVVLQGSSSTNTYNWDVTGGGKLIAAPSGGNNNPFGSTNNTVKATNGNIVLQTNAAGLAAYTYTLAGGGLVAQFAGSGSPISFGNSQTVSITATNSTLIADRLANGAGNSYDFGANSFFTTNGAYTLNVTGGTSVTSGTAALQFGTASMGGNTSLNITNPANGGVTQLTIGVISGGAATLTKTGSGKLLFNGVNSYTGLTTVSDGTIQYGVNDAISSGDVTVNGATAALDLGSSHTDTVGVVTVDGGGLITGSGSSALTSTSSFELKSGMVAVTLAGAVPLNKTTANMVTLTGTHTYTGATNITGGKLVMNGTLSSGGGLVTVGDGANADSGTLMGTGTISRSVKIDKGGSIAPGSSVGKITTGAMTWAGGGTYVWEFNDASDTTGAAAGTKFDYIDIGGALSVTADSGNQFHIDITSLNGLIAGDAAHFSKFMSYDWIIAKASSTVSIDPDVIDFIDHVSNDTSAPTGYGHAGFFSIFGSGNEVHLTFTAVPEPGMFGITSLMMISGFLTRPRRRSLRVRA